MQCDPIDTESCLMKTLIHTRIYALLTQNESNPSELAHAYEEFIETMTEMVANFDNRDDILRILYYSRVEFDVLSHPSFNRYSNNVLRTTFIYKIMYILDCEINIVSNSTKYSSNQDYSFPLSYQDGAFRNNGAVRAARVAGACRCPS